MKTVWLRLRLAYVSAVNLKLRFQMAYYEWRLKVPYGSRAPR